MHLIFALLLASVCGALAGDRPNVLFVFTDDQRYDAVGVVQREQGEHARFPWIRTPNMDRLAAEGFRFRNAFVVNSLCAPSRASFLTGLYGHVNGVVNNHTSFPVDSITFATELRRAGYTTGYMGKWHMGKQPERPGFDVSASFIGQGKYFDCPIYVNGKETPSVGWVDDVVTEYAIDFIRNHKDKPFCLAVGFKATHGPFEPPERRKNEYEGMVARPVPNLGATAIYRTKKGQETKKPGRKGRIPTDGKTNLGYFRCITAADDNLGRLLATLDETHLSERTIVIFASDNGYYLGEHGLGDKRSAYEEALRIPLLLRYPKLGGGNALIDRMVLNIDLAPTLLDLAGVPIPPTMHGRSCRPLLEAKTDVDWRKAWFYCYFFERQFGTPLTTAVRTDGAKLIRYPGHDEWTELFDLAADPYELKNLYNLPEAAALQKQLEQEYDDQAKAIAFRIPVFADKPDPASAIDPALNPGGTAAPADRIVLDFDFTRDDSSAKAIDASGLNNHGSAVNAPITVGRADRKARLFNGKGSIDVPKAPSLDPKNRPWSIRAIVRADSSDGIILARGGRSEGYCLFVKAGLPSFAVTARNRTTTIAGTAPVTGKWVQLVARIHSDKTVSLTVDDQVVARGQLPGFIAADPNDGMQIGTDQRTTVVSGNLPNFSGLIESVQLYSGELK